MNSVDDKLGNSQRRVAPLAAARFRIAEHQDVRLILKNPADRFIAEVPHRSDLSDGIVARHPGRFLFGAGDRNEFGSGRHQKSSVHALKAQPSIAIEQVSVRFRCFISPLAFAAILAD